MAQVNPGFWNGPIIAEPATCDWCQTAYATHVIARLKATDAGVHVADEAFVCFDCADEYRAGKGGK